VVEPTEAVTVAEDSATEAAVAAVVATEAALEAAVAVAQAVDSAAEAAVKRSGSHPPSWEDLLRTERSGHSKKSSDSVSQSKVIMFSYLNIFPLSKIVS
jgi:hypothetical protein